MSFNKKNLLKTLLTGNAGCGCRRPKLSDVYEPKKPKASETQNPRLCSSSSLSSLSSYYDKINALSAMENDDLMTITTTSTSFSFNNIDTTSESEEVDYLPRRPPSKVTLRGGTCPKIIDSVAVVKDSNDPYQDFRHAMLQMIEEKRIYSTDDLRELLQRFLELNSPCHHDVIVRAFKEIWNQMISKEIVVHGEEHGSS